MQLLEREAQLRYLDDVLREVTQESGRTALIYGEAGIGKTSLAEHFLQSRTTDWRLLRGACDALFTPRPLAPFHDIALQTGGDLLTLLESASDRTAIFSACLAELGKRPAIMLVDDCHWADEATLDLLKYLGRRMQQTRSLMILTYRDDELSADHPLRQLLGDLGSSPSLRRIPVSALSRDAVSQMTSGTPVDPVELYRLTNGNAFFVTQVLATEGSIPETVRDAVLARAARLSPAARKVLEATAILGMRVEPWLLSKVAGSDADLVEECLAAGMLVAQGDFHAFRHELVRQTVLASMPPNRKMDLHHLALAALGSRPDKTPFLARLATHAHGAQDASLVLEYAPAAARQASVLGAHRQAASNYRSALQYSGQLPPDERATLLDLYAEECFTSDQLLEADAAGRDALRIWRELGRPEMEGRTLRHLSESTLRSAEESSTQRYADEAIAVLEKGGPSRELARAYSQKSRIHMVAFEAEQAARWAERAIAMAELLGDDDALSQALYSLGTVEMGHGQPAAGSQKLERSLQLALANDLHDRAAAIFYEMARGFRANYDFATCMRYVSDGLEYCDRRDLDNWRLGLWSLHIRSRFDQGDWAEAERLLGSAPRVAGEVWMDSRLELSQLSLEVRRGDPITSARLEALRQRAYAWGFLEIAFPMAAIRAEMAWLQGDLQRCRLEAEPHYHVANKLEVHRFQDELSYWMWRAGALTAPPAASGPFAVQIGGDWRRAAGMWERFGCPYEQGMALKDGDEDAQREALQIFERLGARPIIEKLKQHMRAQGVRSIPRGPRPATRSNAFGLTPRELEVLSAMVGGASNSIIAGRLSLSHRTVEHHITSILQKTGTQSRSEVISLALRENIVAGS
jgi:DNA-binding CsgD family transcriptional regulator/tetratricopeptide (TPR) repeat protein